MHAAGSVSSLIGVPSLLLPKHLAHAKCASHQPCCHHCEVRLSPGKTTACSLQYYLQPRQTGHLCRESRSPCDVPEVCDGRGGDCPADGHLVDGVPCGLDGQCWKVI